MSNLSDLVRKAGAKVGSEYKLAKAMGIPQQNLSDWKAERRNCSPEDRARLAGFAGEDAMQELVRAVLEKHEGTLKGEQLARVLGKRLAQTGGATVTGLLSLASLTSGANAAAHLIRCIVLLSAKAHYTKARKGLFYLASANHC